MWNVHIQNQKKYVVFNFLYSYVKYTSWFEKQKYLEQLYSGLISRSYSTATQKFALCAYNWLFVALS